ncbi:MAG: S8 family serine peptidase [Candidatus Omnitrophica bacterium]|nr:S8 family serine peptidase [Candidatus Omnitrophota bacterium]
MKKKNFVKLIFWGMSLLFIGALLIFYLPHPGYPQGEGAPNSVEILVKLLPSEGGKQAGVKTQVAGRKMSAGVSGVIKELEKLGFKIEDEEEIPIGPLAYSISPAGAKVLSASQHNSRVWARFRINTEQTPKEVCEMLKKDNPEVVCEPNYKVRKMALPNDPKFSAQWALTKIQAPEAWDIQTGSTSTRIAIIDTGCDMDHPDLELNINKSLSYDVLNNDSQPEDDSEDSHGTHIAGIIAGVGNNEKGISGVNWKAELLIYKALDENGEGTMDKLMQAIQRAIDNGAEVINMSWGTEENSLALYEAIQAAYESGIVLVSAGGNDGKVLYPAKYMEVLGVGGTDKEDKRWKEEGYESAYGPEIDVSAPAQDILSTLKWTSEELSYGSLSGTSMSSAFAAGEAGLLLSQKADLQVEEVYSIIKDNVDPVTTEPGKPIGTGRINLFKAIKAVVEGNYNRSPKAVLNASPTQGKAPLKVNFSAEGSTDTDGEIVAYNWDFGDGNTGSGKTTSHTYNKAGTFVVHLSVKDNKGALGKASTVITVETTSGVPGDEVWIVGKVEGIESGEKNPLSGATVVADTSVGEFSADTDASGKYEIKITLSEEDVDSLEVLLTAEASGFQPKEKELTVKPGKKYTANFLLRPESEGGGEDGKGGEGGKKDKSGGCAGLPFQATVCQPFTSGGMVGQVCCQFSGSGQPQCAADVRLPPIGGQQPTPTPTPNSRQ